MLLWKESDVRCIILNTEVNIIMFRHLHLWNHAYLFCELPNFPNGSPARPPSPMKMYRYPSWPNRSCPPLWLDAGSTTSRMVLNKDTQQLDEYAHQTSVHVYRRVQTHSKRSFAIPELPTISLQLKVYTNIKNLSLFVSTCVSLTPNFSPHLSEEWSSWLSSCGNSVNSLIRILSSFLTDTE